MYTRAHVRPRPCGYSESIYGLPASGITEQQVPRLFVTLLKTTPPLSLHHDCYVKIDLTITCEKKTINAFKLHVSLYIVKN